MPIPSKRRPTQQRYAETRTTQASKPMQRKMFWITFIFLGLIADVALPIWWALGATIPIFCISWWVAYRSQWF
jgi:membrane protein insertase Oxa1/YidC/SpoIIIJ